MPLSRFLAKFDEIQWKANRMIRSNLWIAAKQRMDRFTLTSTRETCLRKPNFLKKVPVCEENCSLGNVRSLGKLWPNYATIPVLLFIFVWLLMNWLYVVKLSSLDYDFIILATIYTGPYVWTELSFFKVKKADQMGKHCLLS